MQNKQTKRTAILLFSLLLLSTFFMQQKVLAANGDLKIYIGDEKTARHHRALVLGSQSDVFSFVLSTGTVKSCEFKSSNESIFKVITVSSRKCKIESVKEGTGWLILNVTDTNDKKYEEKVYISVYTPIDSYAAKLNKNSSVYRGASVNAGVENNDNKGNLKENTAVSIIAECNDFYLLKTKDGTTFEDDKDTGFVKKENVDILVNSIKLDKNNISVIVGDSVQLHQTISPDIATEKGVTWQSNDEKAGYVDSNGKVLAKAEGVICIKAKAKDTSGTENDCYITIYKSLTSCAGVVNKNGCKLYKRGNGKVERGTLNKGASVTVVGKCKDYYRVKITDNVFTDGDSDEYCYIKNENITIPVTNIELSQSFVKLSPKQKLKLSATVKPSNATDKTIKWKSSNKSIVNINNSGEITAKRVGTATVTASSSDGSKVATCKVSVSINNEISTYIPRRPSITVEPFSNTKVKVTVTQYDAFRGVILYNKKKKMGQYSPDDGRKAKYWTFYVNKLEIGKRYEFKLKTYVKNKNQMTYSKFSNTVKLRMGKMDFSVNQISQNAVSLTWKKLKKVSCYEISRKNGKGAKWKVIAKVKSKKDSYDDYKLKKEKTYYYRIRPIWKKEDGVYSASKAIKLILFSNVQKYLAKKYPLICMSEKQQINTYAINGKYVPVKYRMKKNELEIHVYLEFVQYSDSNKKDKDGEKIYLKKASMDNERIKRFKDGITTAFSDLQIIGGNGDFKKDINFSTKLIIHDRKVKESCDYNKKQLFIEVLMGGECPNCTSEGNHWYHQNPYNYNAEDYVDYKHTPTIYIPTDEQVIKNTKEGYNIPHSDLESVCAHELGHAFGLYDAYSYYDHGNKIDRCAENDETAFCFSKGKYDNLMKDHIRLKKAKANDIEMMLHAYNIMKGFLFEYDQDDQHYEHYQTYATNQISKVIINTHDEQVETN